MAVLGILDGMAKMDWDRARQRDQMKRRASADAPVIGGDISTLLPKHPKRDDTRPGLGALESTPTGPVTRSERTKAKCDSVWRKVLDPDYRGNVVWHHAAIKRAERAG